VFENVDDFKDVICPCGQDLAFELNDTELSAIHQLSRIRTLCPTCGRPFDVGTLRVEAFALNGFRSPTRTIAGGATSCFAIQIATGEDSPLRGEDAIAAVVPTFRMLCERFVRCPLHDVSEHNA
jgi:hypothetical protein